MITFTAAAKTHLLSAVRPNETLRIAVLGGGCAGMSYSFSFAEEVDEEDILIEMEHVKIYVDPHTLGILGETNIDFVRAGLSEGFVFNNPNANTTCGCGMSFS
tara:strand:- start:365 stop:673 length:309 start_codon:yes stop_codon:yes gene_type:complete